MYKRDNGVWYCDFTYNGKRYHRSLKTKDEQEAKLKLQQLEAEVKLESSSESSSVSLQDVNTPAWMKAAKFKLSDALKLMVQECWEDNPSSQGHIKTIIEILGDVELKDITLNSLSIIKDTLKTKQGRRGKPLSYKTINRYLSSLRTTLNRARDVWLKLDVVPSFKPVMESEVDDGRTRYYTEEERQLIFDFLTHDGSTEALKVRDFIEILFDTGLRRGELLKMTMEDAFLFDVEYPYLTSFKNKEGGVGKSIPLTSKAAGVARRLSLLVIGEYIEKHQIGSYILGDNTVDKARVVLHNLCSPKARLNGITKGIFKLQDTDLEAQSGTSDNVGSVGSNSLRKQELQEHIFKLLKVPLCGLTVGQVEYRWKKLKRNTYLGEDNEAVLHTIRHTVATKIMQRGGSIDEVQSFLNHSSSKTTQRYVHLSVRDKAKTLDKLV